MKTKHSVWALAALITFSSWTNSDNTVVQAKPVGISKITAAPPFAFFRTHRQGRDGVTANWGLLSNNGVTGFVLERTYEDPSDPYAEWQPTCVMACGNQRSFSHRDANITPGLISYRVLAMNGVSTVAVSEISTIQIMQH